MVLGTGDVVPADLRLFEAKDFKVSEMALTGAAHGPIGDRLDFRGFSKALQDLTGDSGFSRRLRGA